MKKTITIVTVLLAGAMLNINAQNNQVKKELEKKEAIKVEPISQKIAPAKTVPVKKTSTNKKSDFVVKEKTANQKVIITNKQPIKVTKIQEAPKQKF